MSWWRSRKHIGITQRLTHFFQEILLAEIQDKVVIFVDEIDSTLSLEFTDDFFAAIRYLYNARATIPDYQRLSFVLIGVATPSDLISDPHRTPFNIGQRVDLTDFTFEEALPLADGLGLQPDAEKQVLKWVLNWTGGHPYLTQRLCRTIAEQYRSHWSEKDVETAVASTFFGKMSEQDNNLQFIRDMLTKRAPDRLKVMAAYREIRLSRRPVRDDEQSLIKNHLKLSGIVRRDNGRLEVRNDIYKNVFDRRWLKDHWPTNWLATVPTSVKLASIAILILLIASITLTIVAINLAKENSDIAAEKSVIAAQEQQASEGLEKSLNEQQKLSEDLQKKNVDYLNASERAINEAQRARQYADRERTARIKIDSLYEETNKAFIVAESLRIETVKNLHEVDSLRRIDIARYLATLAPQQ